MVETRGTGDGTGHVSANQDRGWAWVVAIAGMVALFLGVGVFRTMGLLMVELIDVYETTTTGVSLILTCSGIGYCATGLLLMFGLGDIVHERALLVLAGLLSSLGFITTYFSTKTEEVFVLGICSGAAMQIGFACSTAMIGKYFKKRLAVGSGLVSAGVSLGTLVLPPFVRFLFDEFTYRGAALIMAGISLNMLVSGALMRPRKAVRKDKTGDIGGISESYQFENRQKDERPINHSADSIGPSAHPNVGSVDDAENVVALSHCPVDTEALRPVIQQRGDLLADEIKTTKPATENTCTITKNTECAQLSKRLDLNLRQRRALCSKSFGISVKDFVVRRTKYRPKQESFWENMKSSFGFFKNASFVFYQLFIYFATIGCEGFLQFYPALTKELGLSNYQSAFLLSIVGGADLVGRIFFGVIGDCCFLKRYNLVVIPLFILGTACFLSNFAAVFWSQVIFAVVIGLNIGVTYSFRSVILIDLFGVPTLLRRMGVSNFIAGFAFATAGPILGSIRDETGDYNLHFKIIGAIFICGGLNLSFIGLHKLCRKSDKHTVSS